MTHAYFAAYTSYLKSVQHLTDAETGRLFRACLRYIDAGTVDELAGNELFVFDSIRAQIDRDLRNYENRCNALRENNRARKAKKQDRTAGLRRDGVKEKEKEKEKEKKKESVADVPSAPGAGAPTPTQGNALKPETGAGAAQDAGSLTGCEAAGEPAGRAVMQREAAGEPAGKAGGQRAAAGEPAGRAGGQRAAAGEPAGKAGGQRAAAGEPAKNKHGGAGKTEKPTRAGGALADASNAAARPANSLDGLPPAPTAPGGGMDPAGHGGPPTLEEVQAYCLERKSAVNPARFVNYYAATGWRLGRQPIRDWRAALRAWELNSYRQTSFVPFSAPDRNVLLGCKPGTNKPDPFHQDWNAVFDED